MILLLLKVDCFMLLSLDARRGRLLTNSRYTQTSGAESHLVKLAHSMKVHPSDSLSLQSGKSPLHRSSPAGFVSRWSSLQVPSRNIRTSGHASRRVHKTTFPQPTASAPMHSFRVVSSSSVRPPAFSGAVADLVSR